MANRSAVGFDVVRSPKHHRDRPWHFTSGLNQLLRLCGTILHCECGWHPERVKRVDIAACWKNLRRPDQIATWDRWEELVDSVHLVVLHRAHMWDDELAQKVPERLLGRMQEVEVFAEVPDPEQLTVYLLNHEPFPISGTSIRARQSRGLPIRELVPHEVYSYVEKYGLYRPTGEGDPT